MQKRKGIVTFGGRPVTLLGEELHLGQRAPDFTALRGDLSAFSPASIAGSIAIVSAVPSLDTPVCAEQARRFNEAAVGLGDDVRVLVVSMDLPFAQERFRQVEGIDRLETLSDHRDASFGLAYGLLIEELRLLARAVLVLDRERIVRYEQIVPEVGDHPKYDAALEAARRLL